MIQVDVVNSGDGELLLLLLLFLSAPLHRQLVQLQGDDVVVVYNSLGVSLDPSLLLPEAADV